MMRDSGAIRNIEVPETAVRCYHSVFTGECIPVTNDGSCVLPVSALRSFPVALLMSQASGSEQEECANPQTDSRSRSRRRSCSYRHPVAGQICTNCATDGTPALFKMNSM